MVDGEWIYTEASIWLFVDDKSFDPAMPIPSFITHQVNYWFNQPDVVKADSSGPCDEGYD